jgi:hypothetical protein
MTRPIWQGVSTDSLKFYLGPPRPTLYTLREGHPQNGIMGVSGVPSFTPLDTSRGTVLDMTAQTHNFTEIFGGRDSGRFQNELKQRRAQERARKYKENGTNSGFLAQTV